MPAQAAIDVRVPAELPELTVAYDVNPHLDLLTHDGGDLVLQSFDEGAIGWLTTEMRLHRLSQFPGALETPNRGGEDAIDTSLYDSSRQRADGWVLASGLVLPYLGLDVPRSIAPRGLVPSTASLGSPL
jgi:hypothetical protein